MMAYLAAAALAAIALAAASSKGATGYIAPPPPINLLPLDFGLPQNKHLGSLLLLLLLLSIIFYREL